MGYTISQRLVSPATVAGAGSTYEMTVTRDRELETYTGVITLAGSTATDMTSPKGGDVANVWIRLISQGTGAGSHPITITSNLPRVDVVQTNVATTPVGGKKTVIMLTDMHPGESVSFQYQLKAAGVAVVEPTLTQRVLTYSTAATDGTTYEMILAKPGTLVATSVSACWTAITGAQRYTSPYTSGDGSVPSGSTAFSLLAANGGDSADTTLTLENRTHEIKWLHSSLTYTRVSSPLVTIASGSNINGVPSSVVSIPAFGPGETIVLHIRALTSNPAESGTATYSYGYEFSGVAYPPHAGEAFTLDVTAYTRFAEVNTSDTSTVTVSVQSGPAGGELLGETLIGGTSSGVAEFNNLMFSKAGTYMLKITSSIVTLPAVYTDYIVVGAITQAVTTVDVNISKSPVLAEELFDVTAYIYDQVGGAITSGTAVLSVDASSVLTGLVGASEESILPNGSVTFSNVYWENGSFGDGVLAVTVSGVSGLANMTVNQV